MYLGKVKRRAPETETTGTSGCCGKDFCGVCFNSTTVLHPNLPSLPRRQELLSMDALLGA